MRWSSLVDSLYGLRGKRIGEASHLGPASQGSSTVPALSRDLHEADRGHPFGSDTVLDSEVPHHGVLRVAIDGEDEDDDQSLVDVLERDLTLQDSDTESLEVHSTQSQAPDDSEREDNCSEAGSEVLPPAELEPDPPLMRPLAAAMRAGLPLLEGRI